MTSDFSAFPPLTLDQTLAASFGVELRRLRRAAGLTQAELAERSSFSTVYLGMLERGERLPKASTVDLLAAALALSPPEKLMLGRTLTSPTAPISALPAGRSAAPDLVGRERQVKVLARSIKGDGPHVLCLSGEPGIGKTRLLYEAVEQAERAAWTVLFGACQRRGADSYAPLLDAMLQYLRACSPSRAAAALEGCEWLTRIAPELVARGLLAPPAVLPPERERRLIFDAVSIFLSNISSPAGTLLVLDDMQWAAADAVDLLGAIVRRGSRVVLAYRDTDVDLLDPLSILVADLIHDGLAERFILPPLESNDAEKLLDRVLGDAPSIHAAERNIILRRTGGVPFFVVSFARAAAEGEYENIEDAVPRPLGESLRHRLALLPPPAQDMLQAAVVIGRQASRTLLDAVTSSPDDDAALAVLLRQHLLEEQGDRYRFAHDIIYDVVDAYLSLTRRTLLNRRAAEALEHADGAREVERLAQHYLRSDQPDKALPYLEQAGDRAIARSAHAAAARHYNVLIDRFDALDRPLDAARVREKGARVADTVGAYGDALVMLRRAREVYQAAGDEDGAVRVAVAAAQVYGHSSTPIEGASLLRGQLQRLSPSSGPGPRAALEAALAHMLFLNGEYVEQVEAAERAAALAKDAGDAALMAAAESRKGVGLLLLAKLDEALVVLENAVQLAEAAQEMDSLWRSIGNIGVIYFCRGEFALLVPYEHRALDLAQRQGDPLAIARTQTNIGEGALYRGHWQAARTEFESALATVSALGDSEAKIYPLLDLATLDYYEGHDQKAALLLQEAARLVESSGDRQAQTWCNGVHAEMEIMAGQPKSAVLLLTSSEDPLLLDDMSVLYVLPTLSWAYLESGDQDFAVAAATKAVDRARAMSHRVILVDALRTAAMAALRDGRLDAAAAALDEGIACTRIMPFPYAEARLRHVYADVALRAGNDGGLDEARDHLHAALTLYRELGATPSVERTLFDLESLSYRRRLLDVGLALTPGQWTRIDAAASAPATRGRPHADHRRICAAILYVARSGCKWADLPSVFGDDATAHRRYVRWREDGVWERIMELFAGDAER